uniref:cytochrome c oxidase subunit III n=1 Tax=Telenomus remus TaxID=1569972 RepID=UPI001BEF7E10|nr:cytochrome c oxidase subunit III [Telenomus remus]QTE20724.1 cytochrome c oxidase subunit III [Telenomus remus]QUJ09546.1 cytochrome c oxidase subunit III [Telenomus remus]
MKNLLSQPFHLVTLSPWPILTSMNLMFFMVSMTKMFNFSEKTPLFLSIFSIVLCSYQWWRDTSRESTFQGYHSTFVMEGMKLGMILFIISEVFFFLSFFWSYFHMMLAPSIEIGQSWPPSGMKSLIMNPYNLPLLNTIILISSGMFLSMAHYSIIVKNYEKANILMYLTILLGIIFTLIQNYEYSNAMFSIFTSSYGTTFFMMTGFHGIHVLIGTIFILVSYLRLKFYHFSNIHHIGFEASAWYWHFVDVVWLLLFLFVYWIPF